MTRIHQWLSHLMCRAPGAARHHQAAAQTAWRVATPTDPTQPLWLVPAYQRQRRSGDRLGWR